MQQKIIELNEVLDYQQPTPYIVKSTDYMESGDIPVLTAGKTFILGYTKEKKGIFTGPFPVIIFDDFTTATKLVNFPFKVKSSAMKILLPKANVDIKYIFYFLQTQKFSAETHKRYWISVCAKTKILLPPMSEQKRIVKKIEELFGVIDRDIQRLTDTLEQLSQFRQSVLQQAFSGKLYKTTNWLITTFGKSFISINPKIKIKTKNYLSNGDIPIIDQGEDFISGYWNNKNDAIQISKPVLCFGDHTRRFKYVDFNFVVGADGLKIFQPKDFEPKFGYYAALALKFPNKGYARHSVFLKKCKMYIPSLPEQQKIVDEIEKAFHAADQVQKAVQNALEQAKQLKQSILKRAFEGKLVPQAPNDKPVDLTQIKKDKHK